MYIYYSLCLSLLLLSILITYINLGVSVPSVFKILQEYQETRVLQAPKVYHRQRAILDNIDDKTKSDVRCLIHSFFERNEPPTLDKMIAAVHENEYLPHFKRTTLSNLIKEIGFR